MKGMIAVVLMLAVACGGSDVGPSDAGGDGSVITRGVRGTGPADAGDIWALGHPCSATDFSFCPFPNDAGTCYLGSGKKFCGVPCNLDGTPNCPTGTECGTLVNVPLCAKSCAAPADCPSFTNCYNGLCVPY